MYFKHVLFLYVVYAAGFFAPAPQHERNLHAVEYIMLPRWNEIPVS